ncbi:MAG: c-type cytochrome [Phycisphaerales bacterium]|nr:c-type cytochrome [Phycisphaerales bacterium]
MPNAFRNIAALLGVIVAAACVGACGKISSTDPAENIVLTTQQLAMKNYAQNCSACHGANGVNGAARQLADANYLASVGREALINITTNGVSGGFCPGSGPASLAQWDAKQVADFVDGMLEAWGKNGVALSIPWSVKLAPAGNASNGQAVYAATCQSCHGAPNFKGVTGAGSVTDPNYLRLITDQGLRTAILFGRPERGMPGWSGPFPHQAADRKLSSQEISDVVAFLRSTASQKQ